jgi:hypothetical protein
MSRWIVIGVALLIGILLLGYDQRTDDTGVEAALIIATALALTAAAPRAALPIALAIGLPIAASSVWNGNSAGAMALLMSFAGAFIGYTMRRGMNRAV